MSIIGYRKFVYPLTHLHKITTYDIKKRDNCCCSVFLNKKTLSYAGIPYFSRKEYHRVYVLSLLCSEWEEVGHTQIKHQQMKTFFTHYVNNHIISQISLQNFLKKRRIILRFREITHRSLYRYKMNALNGLLVPLGSTHYCAYTEGLSTL